MASLSNSCTLFTTTTTRAASSSSSPSPNSLSRPFFAKPSHFLTHAKTTTRFRVSCNAGSGERNPKDETKNVDPEGKVDRRNILLGLGGLYGAANLASNPLALATPIQPPDIFNSCGVATDLNTGKLLETSCCPPTLSTNIVDYRLPPVPFTRVRPSAHRVTPEYIFKYNMAIDRMKRLPADDPRNFMQQANIHCAYCNGAYKQTGQEDDKLKIQVHQCWLFFPFHRWYLYFFERICQKLIGDPTFAIPFWNWDNPKGMTSPPMFNDPSSALFDEKRNPETKTNGIVDLAWTQSKDPLDLVTNNLATVYNEMIRSNQSTEDFMGKAYRQGDASSGAGQGAPERGSHTAVHRWAGVQSPTGEDMGNFYSAGRDPLFYCHHGNVDRMWTLWQYFLPSEKLPDKRIIDPDFLNASFLFYDENKQLVRVTVRDCLDNLRMGYEYDRIDLPWLNHRPPPQQVARSRIIKANVPKAESVFPVVVDRIVRAVVSRPKKQNTDNEEVLVLDDIEVDPSKTLKVDVFVNDEDDNPNDLYKASYAGSYAQIPHMTSQSTTTKSSIRLKLTDIFKDMDIEGDDTVLVTLVPRHRGGGITIGGIKIIDVPKKSG